MKGKITSGTVLTSRDLALLETLGLARVLDSDEVKTVAGFASTRRTNRRLLKLVQAGLLRRWFVGTESGGRKALYGLSSQGAMRVGLSPSGLISWKQDSVITNSQFLAHQQAVNAAFIQARFATLPTGFTCRHWRNFNAAISASVPLRPDGYCEIVGAGSVHPMFVEADMGTESSAIWMRKVELYLKLATGGEFERVFGEKRFRVLALFHSEPRLQAIRRATARRTEKLFWFATLDDLRQQGLLASIWLRPKGEVRLPLVQEVPVEGNSRTFADEGKACHYAGNERNAWAKTGPPIGPAFGPGSITKE